MTFRTYGHVVLRDNPVGYWPLNERSGTTANGAGSTAVSGTYASATLASIPFPAGGMAPYFSGASAGGVSIADNAAWSPEAGASGLLSLEAWFCTATAPSNNPPLISKLGSTQFEYELGLRGAQVAAYGINSTGATTILLILNSSATEFGLGLSRWHHTVYTFDRATPAATLYVDGQLVGTSSTATVNATDGTAQLWLGGRADDASASLAGGLAHVALYNYVLSPLSIRNHYRAGLGLPMRGRTRLGVAA